MTQLWAPRALGPGSEDTSVVTSSSPAYGDQNTVGCVRHVGRACSSLPP